MIRIKSTIDHSVTCLSCDPGVGNGSFFLVKWRYKFGAFGYFVYIHHCYIVQVHLDSMSLYTPSPKKQIQFIKILF